MKKKKTDRKNVGRSRLKGERAGKMERRGGSVGEEAVKAVKGGVAIAVAAFGRFRFCGQKR